MRTAVRNPQPWAPGTAQDIAVRIGPFTERAHTRPGGDHGPDMIVVTLVHLDTPHAAVGLSLPDDVGMEPDLARPAGPRPSHRALDGQETTLMPGYRLAARFGPFNVSDHHLFAAPNGTDTSVLLVNAVALVLTPSGGSRWLKHAYGKKRPAEWGFSRVNSEVVV